jgi:hypothetical protein
MLSFPSRSLVAVVLGASLAAMSGCGASTDASGMSSDQATAFARSVSLAAISSMNVTFAPAAGDVAAPSPAERQLEPGPLGPLFTVSCTQTSCVINQPIAATRSCTAGGTIAVTGNISGSISNTGTGLIQISATETITDWMCLPPLVVNGDPYISLVGTFSFLNGFPATQQHVGISGGIKWTGDGAGSCQIQLDTNFNGNGSGHTTGVVCGHAVDVTF